MNEEFPRHGSPISSASPAAGGATMIAPAPRLSAARGRIRRRANDQGAGPLATLAASDWSLGFIGLLLYLLAVITFRFPMAPYAVGIMALGVLMQSRISTPPPFAIGVLCIVIWSLLGVGASNGASTPSIPGSKWERW